MYSHFKGNIEEIFEDRIILDVNDIGYEIYMPESEIVNIKKLKEVGINALKSIEGIGDIKAIELKAMIELGRRIYQEENIEKCTSYSRIP